MLENKDNVAMVQVSLMSWHNFSTSLCPPLTDGVDMGSLLKEITPPVTLIEELRGAGLFFLTRVAVSAVIIIFSGDLQVRMWREMGCKCSYGR